LSYFTESFAEVLVMTDSHKNVFAYFDRYLENKSLLFLVS